ncbi:hypothetical protein HAX54_043466, partial [Datura stramonium]|nr:hypothetical protein [Datura stramonium]
GPNFLSFWNLQLRRGGLRDGPLFRLTIHSSTNDSEVTYSRALVVACILDHVLVNVGVQAYVRVHRERRDTMVSCDLPFDPLKVKAAPRRGKKNRKANLDGEGSEGLRGSRANPSRLAGPFERTEVEMASIRELLEGLPRLLLIGASSSVSTTDPEGLQGAFSSLAQSHIELQEDMKREKRKQPPAETICMHVAKEDAPQYSFLSGFEDEESDELGGGSDKAFS